MSSAIRTENLVKKFRKVTALDGVNLDVPEGAIYALGHIALRPNLVSETYRVDYLSLDTWKVRYIVIIRV